MGEFSFYNGKIKIAPLTDGRLEGLYADLNKIPTTAVIRTKENGDVFTKFGGGTKNLGDFFTDKKIPLRIREDLPLLCDGKNVLVIFGVAISDRIKTDLNTQNIIKFTYEE